MSVSSENFKWKFLFEPWRKRPNLKCFLTASRYAIIKTFPNKSEI